MKRRQAKMDAICESAARLFKDGYSYREIAKRLDLTKDQVKAKVKVGLQAPPQLVRQEKKEP